MSRVPDEADADAPAGSRRAPRGSPARARFRIDPGASSLTLDVHTSVVTLHAAATGIEGDLDVALMADGVVDEREQPGGRLHFAVRRLQRANPAYALEIDRLLDPRRHPEVIVDLASTEPLGPDGEAVAPAADGARDGRTYRAQGTMTLRGVTRPLDGVLVAQFPDPGTIELEGARVVDVRQYGVTPPRLFALRVHPDVRVHLQVVARRAT